MLTKILTWLAILIIVLIIGGSAAYIVTEPAEPDPSSSSARWLQPGPFTVRSTDVTFTDDARSIPANGEFPGADVRALNTTIWYPAEQQGSHPLVVYSHGFMSNRFGGEYMAENLASHGYVVIAPDYPLAYNEATGGPSLVDLMNQPGDVSFLIDAVTGLDEQARPFSGAIDTSRIGVAGISLGGLTSTLAAYHPRLRDPRVAAAISIAGPASMFTPAFFATADIPFLMIAGTIDAIVDYPANASHIPERVADGALVSIENGAHTSFVGLAEPAFRWMDNPDNLGCTAILASIDVAQSEAAEDPFAVLGDEADGIVADPSAAAPCMQNPLPVSLHPGRQQMITQLAVLSFFEAQFAEDSTTAAQAKRQLDMELAADFPEVRFARSTRR